MCAMGRGRLDVSSLQYQVRVFSPTWLPKLKSGSFEKPPGLPLCPAQPSTSPCAPLYVTA